MRPGWLRRTGDWDRVRVREGGGSFLASTGTVAGTETGGLAGSPGSGGCRLRPPSPSLPHIPPPTPARPPPTLARSQCRSSDAGARGSCRRAGTGAGSATAAPLRGGEASAHLRGGSGLSPPFPPQGWARGWGGLRLNPLSRCAPMDGVPGTPGRWDGGRPRRSPPGRMRGQTRRSFGRTEPHCLEGHWGPPGERLSPGNVVHRGPQRDSSLDGGMARWTPGSAEGTCKVPRGNVTVPGKQMAGVTSGKSLRDTGARPRDTPQSWRDLQAGELLVKKRDKSPGRKPTWGRHL